MRDWQPNFGGSVPPPLGTFGSALVVNRVLGVGTFRHAEHMTETAPGSEPTSPVSGRKDDFFAALLDQQLDGWSGLVDEAIHSNLRFSASILTSRCDLAVRLIVNQAVADVNDLLRDIDRGAGRSAMRASRVVIEHAVNLRTVLDSPDSSERYTAHLHHGPVLAENLAIGLRHLSKKEARSERHRLHKHARESRPALDEAVRKFGNGFLRQWHPSNLHDRAQKQGQAALYEFYRYASLTMHGSPASIASARQEISDGVVRVSVGLSIRDMPTAMYIDLSAYLDVLQALEDAELHVIAISSASHSNPSSGAGRRCNGSPAEPTRSSVTTARLREMARSLRFRATGQSGGLPSCAQGSGCGDLNRRSQSLSVPMCRGSSKASPRIDRSSPTPWTIGWLSDCRVPLSQWSTPALDRFPPMPLPR